MISTLIQKKLTLTEESSSMAALGAARLALVGYNQYPVDEILSKPNVIKTILPNSKNSEELIKRFHLWKKIYNQNKSIAQDINQS